jgi:hypothetical protein
MTSRIDIIARAEGTNFRLTPISKFAREYFDLKFGGSVDMTVESVEMDSIQLGKFLRWCDGARAVVMMVDGGVA